MQLYFAQVVISYQIFNLSNAPNLWLDPCVILYLFTYIVHLLQLLSKKSPQYSSPYSPSNVTYHPSPVFNRTWAIKQYQLVAPSQTPWTLSTPLNVFHPTIPRMSRTPSSLISNEPQSHWAIPTWPQALLHSTNFMPTLETRTNLS